jgi:hypothetical protein
MASLLAALEEALAAHKLVPVDGALVELARSYARGIDANAEMLPVYGRGYRETLMELGMTPKIRAALTRGEKEAPKASPIDELRQRRERRAK